MVDGGEEEEEEKKSSSSSQGVTVSRASRFYSAPLLAQPSRGREEAAAAFVVRR